MLTVTENVQEMRVALGAADVLRRAGILAGDKAIERVRRHRSPGHDEALGDPAGRRVTRAAAGLSCIHLPTDLKN